MVRRLAMPCSMMEIMETSPKLPILDSNQDLRLQRPLRCRYANGQKNGRSALADSSGSSEAGSRTRLSRDVKCRVSVPFRPSTDTFTSSYREEGLNEPTHVYGLSNPEPAASSQRHQGESNTPATSGGFPSMASDDGWPSLPPMQYHTGGDNGDCGSGRA